jgi:hypothetical protein
LMAVMVRRDQQTSGFIPVSAVVCAVRTREVKQPKSSRVSHNWSVSYQYIVDGRQYRSSQLWGREEWAYGGDTRDEARARALQNYPVGQAVTAYYNSAKPSDAVLERGTPSLGGLFCPAGLALLGLPGCVYGLLPTWRWLRSTHREGQSASPGTDLGGDAAER